MVRLGVAVVAGLIALVVAGELMGWRVAPLVGWDVAALIYLGWIWLTIWRLEDSETHSFAVREDPSRRAAEATLILASLASLVAVGSALVGTGNDTSPQAIAQVALGVASVVLSWTTVHTVYMLRYAELHYRDPDRGIDFPGSDEPTFRDFAYLAFTMGMTFQVSDTGFKSTTLRSVALRQALLSYVFGTVIVATTINLVAGLRH